MAFAQVVIGPPGSGKTTYCAGMQQFLLATGRPVAVVNLDPANDAFPYKCDVDIGDLITLEDTMETMGLGPNGGIIYCLEYLEANLSWLKEAMDRLEGRYVLFDFPGQVELYTHHHSVRNILRQLQGWGYRLCAVQLVDAQHCADAGKFIAAALLSLNTMLQLELPHINVLSKVDLVEEYGELAFPLDFYTDVVDLSQLLGRLDTGPRAAAEDDEAGEEGAEENVSTGAAGGSAFARKYRRLNAILCELVTDFGLVAFHTLNIQDKESVAKLLQSIDKANGFVMAQSAQRMARDVEAGHRSAAEADAALLSMVQGRDSWAADRHEDAERYTHMFGEPQRRGGS